MWNKATLTLALLLLAVSSAFAGEKADAIYNRYKETEECYSFSLSGPMLKIAMSSAAKRLPEGARISRMNILGFEKEKFQDTDRFWADIDKDLSQSLELITDVTRDGDRVKIFVESRGEDVTSLVFFVMDRNRNVFAVMCNGRVPKEHIEKMLKESTGKK